MAMSDQRLQFLLSADPVFQSRVAIALTSVAHEVLVESNVGATHAARASYAVTVIHNPAGSAVTAAPTLAQSTNVRGTITMEDEGPRTSVTDAALASQVATSWNVLSGIDSGS